jgi:hypothetical protein
MPARVQQGPVSSSANSITDHRARPGSLRVSLPSTSYLAGNQGRIAARSGLGWIETTILTACRMTDSGIRCLGHSDISVTYSRYIDVYTDRDTDAAARFGKLVGSALAENWQNNIRTDPQTLTL